MFGRKDARMDLKGRVAAVTGAASGIGRALALRLADDRCHLALSDVDEAGLASLERQLASTGVTVTTHRVDVADREAVFAWADDVVAAHGAAHVVINNAGIALVDTVDRMKHEDFQRVMDVDFWGVVNGTQAFLPHLERAGDGHIVNISSVFGLVSLATQSAYNAAKFAVRGFTEALHQELELSGGGVTATCVHPGGVATDIARSARMGDVVGTLGSREGILDDFYKRRARMSPARAADIIVDGIRRRRRRVLVGGDAYLVDAIQRLAPVRYQHIGVLAVRRIQSLAARS